MKAPNYTKEEIEFIRQNLHLTDKAIADHLGRPEKAIRTKRQRLQFMKEKRLLPSRWTQPEIDLYVQRWEKHTQNEMCEIYQVGRRAICHINQKLGLRKDRDWRSGIAKVTYQHQKNPRKVRCDAKPVGTITTRFNGEYHLPWIKTETDWERLHIYNWKQSGREIPPKYVVGFKDRNPTNCDLSNLELILRGKQHRRSWICKPRITSDEILARRAERKRITAEKLALKKAQKKQLKQEQKEQQSKARQLKRMLQEEKRKEEKRKQLQEKRIQKATEHNQKLKRTEKRYADKPLNLSEKVAVRVDHKTIVYVTPGTDIQSVINRYKKAS